MSAPTEEPKDALEQSFDRAYGHFGQYDPSNCVHVDMAVMAWDREMVKKQKVREAKRKAARHRRYRCAAVLNPRATGRFTR